MSERQKAIALVEATIPKAIQGGKFEWVVAIERARQEATEPWRDFVEHILAMDALTPGGSNEGWAKRLLAGEVS